VLLFLYYNLLALFKNIYCVVVFVYFTNYVTFALYVGKLLLFTGCTIGQSCQKRECLKRRKVQCTSVAALWNVVYIRSMDTSSWRRFLNSRRSVPFAESSSGLFSHFVIIIVIISIIIIPKRKVRFLGHQISWVSEWVSMQLFSMG